MSKLIIAMASGGLSPLFETGEETDGKDNRGRRPRSPRQALLTIYKANWTLWTSIYRSKTFTKYSFYSLLAYCATDSPLLGAVSFNCTLTSISLFNYVRIFFPALFKDYMALAKNGSGIGTGMFHLGDLLTHGIPFALSIKWLPSWYGRVRGKNLVAVSSASLMYQAAWAYFYASGMDVSAAYDMDRSDNRLTGKDCKRIWVIIAFCHFAVCGFRAGKTLADLRPVFEYLVRDLVSRLKAG
jgi:hypothetical protein